MLTLNNSKQLNESNSYQAGPIERQVKLYKLRISIFLFLSDNNKGVTIKALCYVDNSPKPLSVKHWHFKL